MGCQGCKSQADRAGSGADAGALAARLEALWPAEVPFPPFAPWVAATMGRARFMAELQEHLAERHKDVPERESSAERRSALLPAHYCPVDFLLDQLLGRCGWGAGARPETGGWASCQSQCQSTLGLDAFGVCKMVSSDCTCMWCECDYVGSSGDSPIILT